jgi:hypothetical protein
VKKSDLLRQNYFSASSVKFLNHISQKYMQRYFIAIAFLSLAFFACQDTRYDVKAISPEVAHYRTIGEQIPLETGKRWIEFYNTRNATQGRLLSSYSIPATQINSMLQSVVGLTGVAFQYGTDTLGQKHIIAIPVDASLSLWSSIPGRIFIDANSGNVISQSQAQAWAQTYENLHPNDIWFHFFGKEVFDEIVALPYFDSIDIEPALNDVALTSELLLLIWNDDLNTSGRINSEEEEGRCYDASNPCPPCAVH